MNTRAGITADRAAQVSSALTVLAAVCVAAGAAVLAFAEAYEKARKKTTAER